MSSKVRSSDRRDMIEKSESDETLNLQAKPKLTCIPMHRRDLAAHKSDIGIFNSDREAMPDKSWSVLYVPKRKLTE